ncbi:unnamed protein product [Didymodactylos carnosus]|uniref:Uncharacterized protein n=1 Tax=Didymodactylos carnosus TaxID=1234261 RepID=A0A815FC45_9BILA|nr:unnamed protein product [Didymodactylos carnosus]CAF1323307.1 unnamed protein product [Didymodactylos carnosus]CAF3944987.1 unnamed protein product [Didymodactylos carnosus]CAF4171239.1 unnamed protein product [Didymodactylos carnosus]
MVGHRHLSTLPSIQKSTYKDVLVHFNTLKCLPVGACAYLLNEAPIPTTLDSANSNDEQIQQSLKEYFLYCFLPLPIPSDIPMHIHGCFYLSNESRYNLWKTDNEKDFRRKNFFQLIIHRWIFQTDDSKCLEFYVEQVSKALLDDKLSEEDKLVLFDALGIDLKNQCKNDNKLPDSAYNLSSKTLPRPNRTVR